MKSPNLTQVQTSTAATPIIYYLNNNKENKSGGKKQLGTYNTRQKIWLHDN
jgi:hypothetical protein